MSLQAIYLKFGEYVYVLVRIIYAEFKNDRAKDNGYTGCIKMEKTFFPRKIPTVCTSLLCYSTMSKLTLSVVRDTGNNLLVQ